MDKYQQLQDFLDECIELLWKPRDKIYTHSIYISEFTDIVKFQQGTVPGNCPTSIWHSYHIHALFSKDSGIMEFVVRKPTMSFGEGNQQVRYNEMSMMTANEKIDYFLQNAKLPE